MNIELDFKSFCALYYDAAVKTADITIADHIKKNGPISQYIDVDLVKDLGISYALEKVYCKYDVDHESKAKITTFLSKVVHNCVLTELGKESTRALAGKRKDIVDFAKDPVSCFSKKNKKGNAKGFRDYIESGRKFEKKEELIQEMLACVKKLSGVDQIIINCWMLFDKREYTGEAIEQLGWEDTKKTRNVVQVRCNRAIEMLQKMMSGVRADYRDIYVSPIGEKKSEQTSELKVHSDVDQNYMRRYQRAAKKSISAKVDFIRLSQVLTSSLPD